MKLILLSLLSLACFHSFAQSEEKITIPNGVVYNYTDPKIVEKAKVLIKQNIDDSADYSLSGSMLIIGPVLWNRFKDIEVLKNIQNGNTTFHVGKQELSGKMTQDVSDSKKAWKEVRNEINGQAYIVRKLTERELQYYWAVISFDIDEPLLVVETKEHKYILNILKEDLKLMWLDEVPLDKKQ